MGDENPVSSDVKAFKRESLKKTQTKESNSLPTKEDIEQEKKEQVKTT